MLNNFSAEVKELVEWYDRAVSAVIFAESCDNEGLAYLQPLHEERNALSHFIAALKSEAANNEDEVKKSLLSAIGHLQRAYCDSVEWVLVSVTELYLRMEQQYTNEQIWEVYPEYFADTALRFNSYCKIIDSYKKYKNAAKISSEAAAGYVADITNLTPDKVAAMDDEERDRVVCNVKANEYLNQEILRALEKDRDTFFEKRPEIIRKKKNDKRRISFKDWGIPILSAVLGALVTILAQYALGIS